MGDPSSAKKSPGLGVALKPLDRMIAMARETHTAVRADDETEKVVFDAHRDAIEGRIKEAAKKPGKAIPRPSPRNCGHMASKRRKPRRCAATEPIQYRGKIGRVAARKPRRPVGPAG